MTNAEISQWIDNDEGLYNWHRQSRKSKTAFIKENRKELVEAINGVLNTKPREKTWRDYV
jgi:hypothetical protein